MRSGPFFPPLHSSRMLLFARFDRAGKCLYANTLLREVALDFSEGSSKNPFEALIDHESMKRLESILTADSPTPLQVLELARKNISSSHEIRCLTLEITPVVDEQGVRTGSDVVAVYPKNRLNDKESPEYRRLAESNDQFNSLLTYAPVGMALVEPTGRLIRVNQSFCNLVGYSESELLTMDFQSITHPEDLEKDLNLFHKLLRGEITTFQLEKRYIHKQGYVIWVMLIVTIPQNDQLRGQYVISQIHDITERKKVMDRIIENEERFRLLIENSFDSMTLLNSEGNCIYVSPYVYKMTGYSLEEMQTVKYTRFVHPDDREEAKAFFAKVVANPGKTYKNRHRFLCKNGTTAWIEGYATNMLSLKGLNAVVANYQDITELVLANEKVEENERLFDIERKKAMEELRISEANMRSIFNNTEICYLLLDNECRIISYNKSIEILCHPEDIRRIKDTTKLLLFDLLPPERKNIVRDVINQSIREGKTIEYELNYPSGETLQPSYFQVTIIPVKDEDESKAIGLCMAIQNITTRKQSEIEREKLTSEIVLRNRDLEQFAYIISHNLRAPVANILGLSRVLNEDLSEEEKTFFSQQLALSAEQLDEIIKDLNQIVKIRSEVPEWKENTNLSSIVESVKTSISGIIEKNNVTILTDFDEVRELYTIKSYLFSIFYNLISNSIKFRRLEEHPVIKISTRSLPGKLEIRFEDNGLGIDLARKSDQIFGLFKRFHSHIEGKGMGLYITKTQVEILGGSISVESQVNKGTVFKIEFN